MKTLWLGIGLLALGTGVGVGVGLAAESSDLNAPNKKLGYAMGMNIGSSWKRQGIRLDEVDLNMLLRGIQDGSKGEGGLMTEKEVQDFGREYQAQLRTRQEEIRKVAGEKNQKEGQAFLQSNKAKPGIVTLPSGLQYKVLAEGSGQGPKAGDTVVTHYRGTLIDGKEFDSSYSRGEPATFRVNQVIKGWTEALQLMKPGAKWQLFIPSDLAYGERGAGANIGPHAALIFEVELISVKPEEPAPSANQPVVSDIIKVPSAEELKKGAKIEVIKQEDLQKKQP
jgi:FKBP-type peptidyl-prolyl cis-trans isomerase